MSRKRVVLTGLMTLLMFGAGCTREVSFKQDVFPILSDNCLSCHKLGTEGYIKSGLSMEDYGGLMKGTKFGPVIIPGSHINSTLIILLERKGHPSINMPKDKPGLPESKVELIRKWIDQGAKNN
ncbi:MAG: c-type cytochrome domain-containing protein [Sulfuricaulis sp.]|nr:c-type cytochrome domain-containing protein [Sulfuricaulis sp.]